MRVDTVIHRNGVNKVFCILNTFLPTQHHRLIILYKYGGGYQDLDVLWTSRVPDWVLEHPVVIAPDWPDYGSWPMAFNNGVMLAQRRAPFLHLWLQTFRTYHDKVLFFNSLLMPYKTYEQHPDLVYLDHYLQVLYDGSL